MMMYQILCGHVNYALGKTRMQVKKNQKDTLFWIHVYINLLKIPNYMSHAMMTPQVFVIRVL
jgi:hypothetical protein